MRFERRPLKAIRGGGSAFPVRMPRRSRVQVRRATGCAASACGRGRLRHLSNRVDCQAPEVFRSSSAGTACVSHVPGQGGMSSGATRVIHCVRAGSAAGTSLSAARRLEAAVRVSERNGLRMASWLRPHISQRCWERFLSGRAPIASSLGMRFAAPRKQLRNPRGSGRVQATKTWSLYGKA